MGKAGNCVRDGACGNETARRPLRQEERRRLGHRTGVGVQKAKQLPGQRPVAALDELACDGPAAFLVGFVNQQFQ